MVARDSDHRTIIGSAVRRGGFTLTELLVVIGISVILMGITISVGRSLREGNRMMACKNQLQQINQALKMYRLDENGLPPFYITGADDPDVVDPTGPGLSALYDAGYLSRELTLHCPGDFYTKQGDADYLKSYEIKWDDVGAETELNKHSYLPFRGVANSLDPNYRRQLMPNDPTAAGPTPVPGVDMDWHPLDSTVVMWCGHHIDSITTNGEGQYLVLFWDGSVKKIAKSIMEDATVGSEAWKVTHDDATL